MVLKSSSECVKDTGTPPPHRIEWGFGGTMQRRIPGTSFRQSTDAWVYPLTKKQPYASWTKKPSSSPLTNKQPSTSWGAPTKKPSSSWASSYYGDTSGRTVDSIRCGKATMPDSVANIILIRSVNNKNATIASQEKRIHDLNGELYRLREKKNNEIEFLKESVDLLRVQYDIKK
jgi:hypothetical protein